MPKPKGLGNEPLHCVGAPADVDHSVQLRGRLYGYVDREDRGYMCEF